MDKNSEVEFLKENVSLFISYMKEKYVFINNSNIFLRDIQYGIKSIFEKRNRKLGYSELEKISAAFITFLEGKGILDKLSHNTWKVNYSSPDNVIVDKPGES